MIEIFFYDHDSDIKNNNITIECKKYEIINIYQWDKFIKKNGEIEIIMPKSNVFYYKYELTHDRKLEIAINIPQFGLIGFIFDPRKEVEIIQLDPKLKPNYFIHYLSHSILTEIYDDSIDESNIEQSKEVEDIGYPTEILLEIFSYLNWKDLIKLGRISKRFRKLVFTKSLWNNFTIDFEKLKYPKQLFILLLLENVLHELNSIRLPEMNNFHEKLCLSGRTKPLNSLTIDSKYISNENCSIFIRELIIENFHEGNINLLDLKIRFPKIEIITISYIENYQLQYLILNQKPSDLFANFSIPFQKIMTNLGVGTTIGLHTKDMIDFFLFIKLDGSTNSTIFTNKNYFECLESGMYLL